MAIKINSCVHLKLRVGPASHPASVQHSGSVDESWLYDDDLSSLDIPIEDEDGDWLLEDCPAWLAFRDGRDETPRKVEAMECPGADDTLVLEPLDGEEDEDLFWDSDSFFLFKTCPAEHNGELIWRKTLTEASSSSSCAQQSVLVAAALEGQGSSSDERLTAALEDESKPKMQRLMAFWKAMEQKRS